MGSDESHHACVADILPDDPHLLAIRFPGRWRDGALPGALRLLDLHPAARGAHHVREEQSPAGVHAHDGTLRPRLLDELRNL